jgi:Na+-translocating ferredoxin:NAD+ oxidoreductase RnfD subunit
VKLRRFFQTPKGVLLLLFAVLLGAGVWQEGWRDTVPGLAAAAGVAVLLDGAILRWRKARWVFPSGALLSALIVVMILSPGQPWFVPAATSAVAVLSKYVFRAGTANVFNPAAFALVVAFYLFDTAQDWWGALPGWPPGLVLLLATGIFISSREGKVPLVLWFLGCWFLLAGATAFLGFPERVAELYRSPDVEAALFFAFFMLTDPPTSPPKPRDQPLYGVIVAVVSYVALVTVGAVWFLLAGVLAANVWEAVRRARARSRRPAKVERLAVAASPRPIP